MRFLVLSSFGLSALACWVAVAAAGRVELRIYDPAGHVKVAVALAGVIRSSAHAWRPPRGAAALSVRLTSEGVSACNSLTRSLAKRGAEAHKQQRMALEVNGRIVAAPLIDYQAFPDGLDCAPGIQVNVSSFATAQRLAADIRKG